MCIYIVYIYIIETSIYKTIARQIYLKYIQIFVYEYNNDNLYTICKRRHEDKVACFQFRCDNIMSAYILQSKQFYETEYIDDENERACIKHLRTIVLVLCRYIPYNIYLNVVLYCLVDFDLTYTVIR